MYIHNDSSVIVYPVNELYSHTLYSIMLCGMNLVAKFSPTLCHHARILYSNFTFFFVFFFSYFFSNDKHTAAFRVRDASTRACTARLLCLPHLGRVEGDATACTLVCVIVV